MTERLSRIIGSFLLTSACYVAYAAAVVPLIEPPPPSRASFSVSDEELREAEKDAERQRGDLANWFAEGDWELQSPKILETSQGKLLFHDYQPLDNGLVRITPCSMVFLSSEPEIDPETRKRKALVLRAPQGAILRFDAPIDLKQARIGKLIGGELKGEIFISSGQRLPGPEDDLYIATRDVSLSESEVTTPHLLDFRFGTHRGRGRGVAIELEQATAERGDSELRGIKLLTLHEQIFVHLEPKEGDDVFPGGAEKRRPANEDAAERSPPVEIRCQGPFTFDMQRNLAVFRKQVDVIRVLDGESDHMNGDVLKVTFRAKPSATPAAARPVAAGKPDGLALRPTEKLEPDRIEFTGEPVVIRAPSNKLQARAQYIEHDPTTRQVKLRDATEAIVRHEDREIRAPEMILQPDENGRYGTFIAVGRGRLHGNSPDDPSQSFTAEWQRRLHFRLFEGQYVLSAEGGARFEAVAKGTLAGDEIHAWLKEKPRDPNAPTVIAADGKPPKTELIVDRLLALRDVQIESTQVSGSTQRLEVWFEYVQSAAVVRRAMYWPAEAAVYVLPALGAEPLRFPTEAAPREPVAPTPTLPPTMPPPLPAPEPQAPAGPVLAPPRPYAAIPLDAVVPPVRVAAVPDPNSQPSGLMPGLPAPLRQFHIDGQVMRVLAQLDDRKMQFREAVVEGGVKLRETQVGAPAEQPLLIQGERLHLTQPAADASHVEVSGNPAYVEARGLTMSGGKLVLDRPNAQTNLLTIPAQGLMTLPLDRDLQGRPKAVPEILTLTWQGGLTFDGLTARFERGIEARLTNQLLRTDRLDVTFDRPVQFGESGGGPRPDIRRLDCFDGAFIESRTIEADTLRSVDKLQARTMSVDRPTGEFAAEGPGELTSVRLGEPGKPNLPIPGGLTGAAAGVPAIPIVGAEGRAATTINYLHAKFQRALTGNEFKREMTLYNQVRVLYGPVADWNTAIDPDNPKSWHKQTIQIDCDQLQVTAQRNAAAATDSYNLVAEGNTLVEGSSFTARAPRLTYAQAKDLLVIEGDARTEAELYHQKRPGSQPSGTTASRFMIWPSTNRVQVDGATFLDLTPN